MKRASITAQLIALLLAVVSGCTGGRRNADDEPHYPRVDAELLGSRYENDALGVAFRPPRGWQPLDASQRERVSQALLAREDDDAWGLRVEDLFLDAETLSSVAVSEVLRDGDPSTDPNAYVAAIDTSVQRARAPDTSERVGLTLNSLPVILFNNRGDGRESTTVVVDTGRRVIQFDYSIPAEDDARSARVESSLGTIRPLDSGNKE